MTDDLVKRLRSPTEHEAWLFSVPYQAADRIERMQDIIARIQHTNLRRDMNAKSRTTEIDKLCKERKEEK